MGDKFEICISGAIGEKRIQDPPVVTHAEAWFEPASSHSMSIVYMKFILPGWHQRQQD